MIEVIVGEGDQIDRALKAFKRKVQKSGILRELRERRFYMKPSVARAMKEASAIRRKRRAKRAGTPE
jgi:small subunit ribosomal protein S21